MIPLETSYSAVAFLTVLLRRQTLNNIIDVLARAIFCGMPPAPRHSFWQMPQLCTSCAAWQLAAAAASSACSGWRCKTSMAGGLQQLAHRGRAQVQLHGSCMSCWYQHMPLRDDASYRRCQLRSLKRAARQCCCPCSSGGGLWLCLRNGVLLRQAASGELESMVLETHTALQARHAGNHADECMGLLTPPDGVLTQSSEHVIPAVASCRQWHGS